MHVVKIHLAVCGLSAKQNFKPALLGNKPKIEHMILFNILKTEASPFWLNTNNLYLFYHDLTFCLFENVCYTMLCS